MYLIIGLGNPESDYSRTRHNMGFDVINKIASKFKIEINRTKYNSKYGTGEIHGEKVILVKPQTYMNNSGEAIQEFVHFYQIEMHKLIVIYDDIDINKGIAKIRKKGGAGTHNGMKSVVQALNTEEFPRIRVGIGTPKFKNDMINYVLGHIADEEYDILQTGIEKAALEAEEIIKNGIDKAMNKYN